MSSPTVKFCLDHPHKWLQIFQVSGKAGRFNLEKPGHPPKHSPICLFLGYTSNIVIYSAKKHTDFIVQCKIMGALMDLALDLKFLLIH